MIALLATIILLPIALAALALDLGRFAVSAAAALVSELGSHLHVAR
jgi:hypothetical protein